MFLAHQVEKPWKKQPIHRWLFDCFVYLPSPKTKHRYKRSLKNGGWEIQYIYIYIYTYTHTFLSGQIALFSEGHLICCSFFNGSLKTLISEGSHCLEHVLANDECWLLELARFAQRCRRCNQKKRGSMFFWAFLMLRFVFLQRKARRFKMKVRKM